MNSKVQFRMFTIFDLDKVEDYLHEMHLKGWKFKSNRFGFFYFEQCDQMTWFTVCGILATLEKMRWSYKVLRIEDGNFVGNCSYLVFRKQLVM